MTGTPGRRRGEPASGLSGMPTVENCPETRSDNRPEAQPDNRPETRPDNRPETRPDNRPETRPDNRPEDLARQLSTPTAGKIRSWHVQLYRGMSGLAVVASGADNGLRR
jgi:hypothetical protein